jgi:predicted O-methyltransferase YrrM
VDNVVREGNVIDAKNRKGDVRATRHMTELIAGHPRLTATALQTVGVKGYDGFILALLES